GLEFGHIRKSKLFLSGSLGFYNAGYVAPYLYGPYGLAPVSYPPVSQITIIALPQPASQSGFGDLAGLAEALRQQQFEQREPPVVEKPLPGVPAGGCRPSRPQDRARAQH